MAASEVSVEIPSRAGKLHVAEEMAGKHVLVTGGTGFMGKVLIEKLLRSCPDIECIYVLLRPKKGIAIQERLKQMFSLPLFERLLTERPSSVDKVRAVAGDCSELRLGLSEDDEAEMQEKVHYVFHAAASVRFDDPLKTAILLNTRGTREVVELCKRMKNLRALEYVSTTYCFTREPVLKEKHYPADLDWRTMIRLAETEDAKALDTVSYKILDFQPNTYTFTKALAENVINDARNDIPVIIFRPAVVVSTVTEPIPGWLDNLNGPFGIWVGASKGVLRFIYCDPDVALSYSPVDWAIRGMVVCAVARAQNSPALCSTPGALDVVNLEASKHHRMTYRDQMNYLDSMVQHVTRPVRLPRVHMGNTYVIYWLGTVLSQLPYGLLIDTLLRLKGQKPRLMSAYRRIFHAKEALRFFMLNEFPIETEKSDFLNTAIKEEECFTFGLGVGCGLTTDLNEIVCSTMQGATKYVFKESSTVVENEKWMMKLRILEFLLNTVWAFFLYMTLGRFLVSRMPGVRDMGI